MPRKEDFSDSARQQYEMLEVLGVKIVTELPVESYSMVIDGIFGVGLSRPIMGAVAKVIETVNQWECYKISLDIPSGIDGTTGKILGSGFQADCTITYGFLKRGLCLYPGAEYAGEVIVKKMGITEDSFLGAIPKMFSLTGKPLEYLPKRPKTGHKGTFGKIAIIAGSEMVGGAAVLAAKAAMMTGCGMVKICTHKNQQTMISTLLPEALLEVYESEEEAKEAVNQTLNWADVIALGPGLGTEKNAKVIWNTVIEGEKKPLVLDADGLNLLALPECVSLLKKLQNGDNTKRPLIMTPHPLELARITGKSVAEIKESRTEILKKTAQEFQASVIQKDARTIIGDEQGNFCINVTGNSGMATAGSGDVLTGITAALYGLGLSAFESAYIGVYLHGTAGDKGAELKNLYSMTASDICEALTEILKDDNKKSL